MGRGQEGGVKEFQISQRADYFETEVGLETTLKRPIINTRDEPHADPEKYRRLHVIVGDANMSETATMLKMGTTSLILALIESGFNDFGRFELSDPVGSMSKVSYDLSMQQVLPMASGKSLRAIDIQYLYLDTIRAHLFAGTEPDRQTEEILQLWQSTLDALDDRHRGIFGGGSIRRLGVQIPNHAGLPKSGFFGLGFTSVSADRFAIQRH